MLPNPNGSALLAVSQAAASQAAARESEGFGCKIVGQYAVLGPYDFVTILEAPDNETVAHLSVDSASRGTVKIQALPASPLPDLLKKLKGKAPIGKS